MKQIESFDKSPGINDMLAETARTKEYQIRENAKEVFFKKLEAFCLEHNIDSLTFTKHCLTQFRETMRLMYSLDPVPDDEYNAFFNTIKNAFLR